MKIVGYSVKSCISYFAVGPKSHLFIILMHFLIFHMSVDYYLCHEMTIKYLNIILGITVGNLGV
jgi:hypothetical protein